jgi:hypothetical protein
MYSISTVSVIRLHSGNNYISKVHNPNVLLQATARDKAPAAIHATRVPIVCGVCTVGSPLESSCWQRFNPTESNGFIPPSGLATYSTWLVTHAWKYGPRGTVYVCRRRTFGARIIGQSQSHRLSSLYRPLFSCHCHCRCDCNGRCRCCCC